MPDLFANAPAAGPLTPLAERLRPKTIDEVIATKPTAIFDEKWGKGFTTPEMFTRFVYQGV